MAEATASAAWAAETALARPGMGEVETVEARAVPEAVERVVATATAADAAGETDPVAGVVRRMRPRTGPGSGPALELSRLE